MPLKLQLLYFQGCPNVDLARSCARSVLEEFPQVLFEEVDVQAASTPGELRSWGSPTFLLAGRDIANGSASGSCCRLYDDHHPESRGVPSEDALRRALLAVAGPTFEERGVGVDEALLALGLVDENFYESLCPAEPGAVRELETRWGAPLPAGYRSFLDSAGASLGTLQIRDWRTAWDFRATSISRLLEDSEAPRVKGWRRDGRLPIANQGPTTELGYEDDVHLMLDLQSGELTSEDPNRESYEGLPALILEWGFRLLDPRMAVPFPAARAWSTGGLSGGRIDQLHGLAASMQTGNEGRYLGQRVGIYLFHDSGVTLKLQSAEEMKVEARHARRRAPDSTQASAFLREAEAAGWLSEA